MMLSYEALVQLIRDAGKVPVERNSLYEPVDAAARELVGAGRE